MSLVVSGQSMDSLEYSNHDLNSSLGSSFGKPCLSAVHPPLFVSARFCHYMKTTQTSSHCHYIIYHIIESPGKSRRGSLKTPRSRVLFSTKVTVKVIGSPNLEYDHLKHLCNNEVPVNVDVEVNYPIYGNGN